VKFLIDNSISPAVAAGLRRARHDAAHLRDYGIASVPDDAVIERALAEERTAVTYDLDFPRLLFFRRHAKPSLIIFRRGLRHPLAQAAAIVDNLPALRHDLNEGCIAVIEPDRIRIRGLPLTGRKSPPDA